ncbi:hypothetical protein [Phyllobacterium zundukense]|uniref:Chitin-binding type-3 domain-containing protein n=1 Tax=Phyllobacterium zundukense TaxID=1867719 RepID=A0A2N9VS56_9HYPH|nr:hypothetical protein [Phyllobacterium zundukense]ATU92746.1 hypothetical protein BLM14_14740 [Phyllobacterium zundukense]PIO42324.1 hypothetical protein B5P45_25200 [Phyllobacterium zundukense]
MAIRNDYQAGTVSITAGTTALVGAGGANWTAADIQPGDTFLVENLVAVVAAVVDSTHITLAEPWTGTTLSAAPYRIRYQPDGSRYSAALRDMVDQLGNGNILALSGLTGALDEIPIFTGAGAMTLISKEELIRGVDVDVKVETLADRAAYDGQATGYSVLVGDVGDGRSAIYFKLSSTLADWSDPAYLTGANGTFQSKGAYSGATAYVIGDVVLQNGSSWIARVNTTGNAPPTLPTTSNTQWFLLSAAGSGFVFRGAYSGATAYLKDDVVVSQNSSWIALQATTGNAPPTLPTTSNANWQALAVRGAGDVSGPASSVDSTPAVFDDVTGKQIKNITYAAFKTAATLNNVDNTSDANKPVSTAQNTALSLKYDKSGGQLSGKITLNFNPNVWGIDASVFPINLAAASNFGITAGSGLIMVTDEGTGCSALFICGGGVTTLVAQTAATFGTVAGGGPGYVRLGYDAGSGAYYFGNFATFGITIRLVAIKTRPSA